MAERREGALTVLLQQALYLLLTPALLCNACCRSSRYIWRSQPELAARPGPGAGVLMDMPGTLRGSPAGHIEEDPGFCDPY